MFYQFDNNYSALLSRDKFNIAYEEYFGNLFIRMSEIHSSDVQKEILYHFVCFARLLCGPNIAALRDERNDSADFLRNVMHQWMKDYFGDYSQLLDGVNCFLVGPDKLKSIASFMETELKVVGTAMGPKYHALLLYKNELVRLFSATQSSQLASHDVGHLMSLAHGVLQNRKTEFFNAFLNGPQGYDCVPHVVAVTNYSEFDLKLIIAVEAANTDIARSLHKSLSFLNKVYNFTVRLDADNVKVVVDKIDFYMNQVQHSLKVAKGVASPVHAEELDGFMRILEKKWNTLKKKLAEWIKISYKDVLKQLDSSLPSLIDTLQSIFRAVYIDGQRVLMENEPVCQMCESGVVNALRGYHTIFTLNHHGALVKSYMDEFHGLIHFIFVNKSTGRVIAPELPTERPIIDRRAVREDKSFSPISSNDSRLFSSTFQIRNYIKISKKYAAKGHLSNIWKNASYCFSYFMWSEESTGGYVKAKDVIKANQHKSPKDAATNPLVTTFNDLTEELQTTSNYYQKFADAFFSKQEVATSYELYLFHLAFVTSGCALEHGRRIAVTINDILGSSDNHWDLL